MHAEDRLTAHHLHVVHLLQQQTQLRVAAVDVAHYYDAPWMKLLRAEHLVDVLWYTAACTQTQYYQWLLEKNNRFDQVSGDFHRSIEAGTAGKR